MLIFLNSLARAFRKMTWSSVKALMEYWHRGREHLDMGPVILLQGVF
jgi:hypothetical protein